MGVTGDIIVKSYTKYYQLGLGKITSFNNFRQASQAGCTCYWILQPQKFETSQGLDCGSMSFSMSISDEIEDATIAIDETKISETEATKRRIRNYCVQTKKIKI